MREEVDGKGGMIWDGNGNGVEWKGRMEHCPFGTSYVILDPLLVQPFSQLCILNILS